MNYDDFKTSHFARNRIKNAIRKKYFWSKMIKEITKYVRICSNCQKMRVHHHKSYENLTFISSNNVKLFYIVTMNFITNMLYVKNSYTDKTSDFILMMMNKLIKHAIYVAIIKNLNVKDFANVLWRKFITQHEMMQNIIFNRNSLFTSHF